MKRGKKLIAALAFLSVVIVAFAVAAFFMLKPGWSGMPETEVQLPDLLEPAEKGEEEVADTAVSEKEEWAGATPEMPGIPVCPPQLSVDSFVDHKQTATPTDDDVYIGVRNNKPMEEELTVVVGGVTEGAIEVKSLGFTVIKSGIITNWWRSLEDTTTEDFNVELLPASCSPVTTMLSVRFPREEADYLD